MFFKSLLSMLAVLFVLPLCVNAQNDVELGRTEGMVKKQANMWIAKHIIFFEDKEKNTYVRFGEEKDADVCVFTKPEVLELKKAMEAAIKLMEEFRRKRHEGSKEIAAIGGEEGGTLKVFVVAQKYGRNAKIILQPNGNTDLYLNHSNARDVINIIKKEKQVYREL